MIRKCFVFQGKLKSVPLMCTRRGYCRGHILFAFSLLGANIHITDFLKFLPPPFAKFHPSILAEVYLKSTCFRELSGDWHHCPLHTHNIPVGFSLYFVRLMDSFNIWVSHRQGHLIYITENNKCFFHLNSFFSFAKDSVIDFKCYLGKVMVYSHWSNASLNVAVNVLFWTTNYYLIQ